LLDSSRAATPRLLALFVTLALLDLIGLSLFAAVAAALVDSAAVTRWVPEILEGQLDRLSETHITFLLAGFLMATFTAKLVASIFCQRSILMFCARHQVVLQKNLLEKYQSMPYETYRARSIEEYLAAIQVYARVLAVSVYLPTGRAISDIVVGVAILGFLVWTDVEFFLIALIIMILTSAGYDGLFRKKLGQSGRNANLGAQKIYRVLGEAIKGLDEIRILGKSNYFRDEFLKGAKVWANNMAKQSLIAVLPRYFLEFIIILMATLTMVYLLNLQEDKTQIIPVLLVFGFAGARLLPIFISINTALVQVRFNRDAVGRLYREFNEPGSSKESSASELDVKKPTEEEFRDLRLESVSYAYPGRDGKVIDKLSLSVKAGEIVGISGTSGSGKSTLLAIILGLLEPSNGKIRVNGMPTLTQLPWWWSKIAYVPQEAFLINDSIRANVALGESPEEQNSERILSALSSAGLEDLLDTLPDGIETRVGGGGGQLSGGQKQRLAIARARYFERRFMVFDESTSALDGTTEKEIISEFFRPIPDVTTIIVSHSPLAFRNCTSVYRLVSGSLLKSE
jgi:ATP-binding cassette, subfamily B, bacterial PglK